MDLRCPDCQQIVLVKITSVVDPDEFQRKLQRHQSRCMKRAKQPA